MFKKEIYIQRREALIKKVNSGVILMLGNDEIPMNFTANPYYFRQDSTFLYYFGLDLPGMSALIDVDTNECTLFGDDPDWDDIIWMGPQKPLIDLVAEVGIENVMPSAELGIVLNKVLKNKREVHFLPPYREEQKFRYTNYLHLERKTLREKASQILITSVIEQRSVKIEEEIWEIEKAPPLQDSLPLLSESPQP